MSQSSIFPELYVRSIPKYISFFVDCLKFKVVRDEGSFAELRNGDSTLLLNAYAGDVSGHFFHNKISQENNGIGVEIGIIVDDIYKSFAICKKHEIVREVSDVSVQSWGMTDFRLVTIDNYYLRITSPMVK